jgi:hypothetical protein
VSAHNDRTSSSSAEQLGIVEGKRTVKSAADAADAKEGKDGKDATASSLSDSTAMDESEDSSASSSSGSSGSAPSILSQSVHDMRKSFKRSARDDEKKALDLDAFVSAKFDVNLPKAKKQVRSSCAEWSFTLLVLQKADPEDRAELRAYWKEPPTDLKPLEWWRLNAFRYPVLSRVARRYLCIPATAAPVERVWSHAGRIVSALRASLGSTQIRAQVMNHDNIDMVRQAIAAAVKAHEAEK